MRCIECCVMPFPQPWTYEKILQFHIMKQEKRSPSKSNRWTEFLKKRNFTYR